MSPAENLTKSKLYYYPDKKQIYKLLDYTKSPDGVVVTVKLLKQNSDEELTLDKDSEISTLRDYVLANIKLFADSGPGEVISSRVKLQK